MKTITNFLVILTCILIFSPNIVFAQTNNAPRKINLSSTQSTNLTATRGSQILLKLDSLAVKPRASRKGYLREKFGTTWLDVDHNGCDTRNDILKRDLIVKTFSGKCIITFGILLDKYSNKTIIFRRGTTTSSKVQVDHIVALSDAWQKGAQQISIQKRIELANDPLNLQAVDGKLNQQKSDKDATSWLPPNKAYRCVYVMRQVEIKKKYNLWITADEKIAMKSVLTKC